MKHLCTLMAFACLVTDAGAANISGKVTVARSVNNAEAVVYIEKISGKTFTPPKDSQTLDQLNLKFVPHVLPILVGTTVAFPNSDVVRHNVFSPSRTQQFTLGTYPVKQKKFQVFNKPGVVTLLCNIHAEMSAYIVVTETPYWAISNAAGDYTIPDVPPGRYVLRIWHENFTKTAPVSVTVAGDVTGINFELRN